MEVITYLEMTGPDELIPARPVPGVAPEEVVLEEVDSTCPIIPDLQARIGAPHGWRSATRTAAEWAQWLTHPHRRYWLIRYHAEIIGMADIEPGTGGEVEISTFGLLPEHVGRRLGGQALTLVVRRAWSIVPPDRTPVWRVWLRTSSYDHPNALPNYRRRGFRPYQTVTLPEV